MSVTLTQIFVQSLIGILLPKSTLLCDDVQNHESIHNLHVELELGEVNNSWNAFFSWMVLLYSWITGRLKSLNVHTYLGNVQWFQSCVIFGNVTKWDRRGIGRSTPWQNPFPFLPSQAKIVHGSWACTCPCSCPKHNRFSLATPMKFGNFGPYFMLFMPTIIVTSCTVHAMFMPSSCMFMAWTGYEQRL